MFLKSFYNFLDQHHNISRHAKLLKSLLVVLSSLVLASCILGSSDRTSNSAEDSNANTNSDLDLDVDSEQATDVLQETTLHDFRLLGFTDKFEVVNDIMDAEIISYARPPETDDVDSNSDFENVINPTGTSWDDRSCSWQDGNDPVVNTNRPYVRLTAAGGWAASATDSNSAPRLEMIDDEIHELLGAVVYQWVILADNEITINVGGSERNFAIDGEDLDVYYTWIEYLLTTGIPATAKFDNHVDDLKWLNRDNVDDTSIWDDTIGDASFSNEARIYTVSRWVRQTEYVIESFTSNGTSYAFNSFDHGLGAIGDALTAAFPNLVLPDFPNANVMTYRDLQLGLLRDGDIYMAFATDFNDNLNCAEGGMSGDIVGTYEAASSVIETSNGIENETLQPYILVPRNIILECVGQASLYILDMTPAQKIAAGLGGYYDLFIAEPNSDALPERFYFGRKYNKTTKDPVKNKTAIPLLLYNTAAKDDLKNAFQNWRKADYLDAEQSCGSG